MSHLKCIILPFSKHCYTEMAAEGFHNVSLMQTDSEKRSPKVIRIILRGIWTCEPHFIAIKTILVKTFCSKLQIWAQTVSCYNHKAAVFLLFDILAWRTGANDPQWTVSTPSSLNIWRLPAWARSSYHMHVSHLCSTGWLAVHRGWRWRRRTCTPPSVRRWDIVVETGQGWKHWGETQGDVFTEQHSWTIMNKKALKAQYNFICIVPV